MEKLTSVNLSDFRSREREMAEELLKAWREQGLPEDFYDDNVRIMMNFYSGNVFLTNNDCQVAMMNGDELESFYTLPCSGEEGFKEYFEDGKKDDYHKDDWEYIKDVIGLKVKIIDQDDPNFQEKLEDVFEGR